MLPPDLLTNIIRMHSTNNEPEHPIFEYNEIDESVIIGTNACCDIHFNKGLLTDGVDADISLEGEKVDRPFGVKTYLWLPTEDHTPPSKDNVDVGVDALDAIIAQGRKVYIHCKNGHGRAPTFYAAYLILKRDMNADDAVAHIMAKRPTAHIEESQLAFLKGLELARQD